MPAYKEPPKTQQRVFNTDEISRRADPEWVRDRNYLPAYKFTGRTFIDHRDNVYDDPYMGIPGWPEDPSTPPVDPLDPINPPPNALPVTADIIDHTADSTLVNTDEVS